MTKSGEDGRIRKNAKNNAEFAKCDGERTKPTPKNLWPQWGHPEKQHIPISGTSEKMGVPLLNALWPTHRPGKIPEKRQTYPQNDTKIHKVDINEYNENNQRHGIRKWNNTCYMVSPIRILNDMDLPQGQENLNIKPLLKHIRTNQNLAAEQRRHYIHQLTQRCNDKEQ